METFSKFMLDFYKNISTADGFHDLIFEVNIEQFPVHRYIIASHCRKLGHLPTLEETNIVKLRGIHPQIFEQVLKFIYSGDCDLIHEGVCNLKIPKSYEITCKFGYMLQNGYFADIDSNYRIDTFFDSNSTFKDPIELLRKAAYDLDLIDLRGKLINVRYKRGIISYYDYLERNRFIKDPVFNRLQNQHLFDLRLVSQDERYINVHKCMLVPHEYFRAILSNCWQMANCGILRLEFEFETLKQLVNFFYTGTIECYTCSISDDLQFWSRMLQTADQFLLQRLKDICQVHIIGHIKSGSADIKNISDLAEKFNAEDLKQTCISHIRHKHDHYEF